MSNPMENVKPLYPDSSGDQSAVVSPITDRVFKNAPVEGRPDIRECQILLRSDESVYWPVHELQPAMRITDTIQVTPGLVAHITPISLHPSPKNTESFAGTGVVDFDNVHQHLKNGSMIVRQTISIGDGNMFPAAYEAGLRRNDEALDEQLKYPANVGSPREALRALDEHRRTNPTIVFGASDQQMLDLGSPESFLSYPTKSLGEGYRIAALIGSTEDASTTIVPCPEESSPQAVVSRSSAELLGWLVIDGFGGVLVAGRSVGIPNASRSGYDPTSLLLSVRDEEYLDLIEVMPEISERLIASPPPQKRTFWRPSQPRTDMPFTPLVRQRQQPKMTKSSTVNTPPTAASTHQNLQPGVGADEGIVESEGIVVFGGDDE